MRIQIKRRKSLVLARHMFISESTHERWDWIIFLSWRGAHARLIAAFIKRWGWSISNVMVVKASQIDPKVNVVKVPFSRFFISQDTGGAIRGNARCDLYFGYGVSRTLPTTWMKWVRQYFLIAKIISMPDFLNQRWLQDLENPLSPSSFSLNFSVAWCPPAK